MSSHGAWAAVLIAAFGAPTPPDASAQCICDILTAGTVERGWSWDSITALLRKHNKSDPSSHALKGDV